ncbi:MAG: FG-GAP repeat domain-containing protein [Aquirufa sp.]
MVKFTAFFQFNMMRNCLKCVFLVLLLWSCSKASDPTPITSTTPPATTNPTETPIKVSDYKNKTTNQIRLESTIWDWPIDIDITFYADIDLDGDEDIFGTKQNAKSLIKINQAGVFTNQTIDDPNSIFIFPRSVIGNDFNGDGYIDFVVLAHNNEQINPNPGEIPSLFLNNKDKTFKVSKLDIKSAFWHLGSSADVDKDGDNDLLICTAGSIQMMLNDGSGKFTKSDQWIPNSYANCNLIGGMLEDFNGDGWMDLLVFGHEYNDLTNAPFPSKTRILFGSSSLKYAESNSLVIDSDKTGFGIVLDALYTDLNNDGKKELILVRTGDPVNFSFYKGYKIQILNGNTDVTASFISNSFNKSESSINWIKVLDVNNDGKKDIVDGEKRRNIYFMMK